MPLVLDHWIDQRIEEGRYVSAREYICDLIRRDIAAPLADLELNATEQTGAKLDLQSDDSSC